MEARDSQGVGDHTESVNSATTGRIPAIVWFCLGYYSLATANGVRSAVVAQRSAGDLIFDVAFSVCLYTWVAGDARRRQKPIPWSLRLWVFAFAVLVVPAYVIATRSWKGAGWVVFHALGWVIFGTFSMLVTTVIYFGLLR